MRVAGRSGSAIGMSTVLRLFVGSALTAALFFAHAQVITTVAGTNFTFPNTPLAAINAPLGSVSGVAADAEGNVYIADSDNDLVLRLMQDGTVIVVAGNGIRGFSGDGGPATNATLDFPYGIAFDAADNLYIADWGNNRIRKVSGGIITTVAGNGAFGFSGDGGPATSATLDFPRGIAVDAADNLYIADTSNNRIRKVSGGIITTVAGNGTGGVLGGFSGDGGPATSAALRFPYGIAVDAAGNLFIADSGNDRIRKVSGGIITTVAGNGGFNFSGDGGPATRFGTLARAARRCF